MTHAPARIAVVGGGIAGAATVLALAREGHRALWFTGSQARGHLPFGESLSPAAAPLLQSLGLGHLLACPQHRPSNTSFMSWGGRLAERSGAIHLEGPGLVLDRCRFEHDLVAAAAEVAETVTLKVLQATTTGAGWQLALENGEHSRTLLLIDATGRAARFARPHATRRIIDRQVAITATLCQVNDDVEPTPATLIEAVPAGWWYAALLPSGRLSLAVFTDPDLLQRAQTRDADGFRNLWLSTQYINRWIGDAGFDLVTPPHLTSAATACLNPPAGHTAAGDPWAAVGDAAASFDPLSSHGITTALWSGLQAGRAAAQWLAGDAGPLAAYAQAVARGFEAFLVQRSAIYASEYRFSRQPYWRRRNAGLH